MTTGTARPWLGWRVAWSLALGVGALVLATHLGGTVPASAPAGLPDAGAFTGWALPVAGLLADLAAVVLIGFLALPAVLLGEDGNALRHTELRALGVAARAGVVLAFAVAAQIVFGAGTALGLPVFDGLRLADVWTFLAGTPQGWACGARLVLVCGVAAVVPRLRTVSGVWRVFVAALVVAVLPALVGHAATSEQHSVAAMILVAHVIAALVWTGGLASLVWLAVRAPADLRPAVRRFSGLALGCAAAVGVSGLVAGVLHAGSLDRLVVGGYALLLGSKVLLYLLLIVCGWAHRRHVLPLPADRVRGPFVRLAVVELSVMIMAFGTAVALARTPLTG